MNDTGRYSIVDMRCSTHHSISADGQPSCARSNREEWKTNCVCRGRHPTTTAPVIRCKNNNSHSDNDNSASIIASNSICLVAIPIYIPTHAHKHNKGPTQNAIPIACSALMLMMRSSMACTWMWWMIKIFSIGNSANPLYLSEDHQMFIASNFDCLRRAPMTIYLP